MMVRPTVRRVFLCLLAPASCLILAAPVHAEIQRASISASGQQGNGFSAAPSLSADGKFVAFASEADNLVDGDTNEAADIFVKDLTTGEIRLVSVTASGEQGNDLSAGPSISADGTVVAFHSLASNLVAGDSNEQADIFVKTLATGEIQRVSVSATGEQGGGVSAYPSISADGKVVGFSSFSKLAPEDMNALEDVYVKNLTTGEVIYVEAAASGTSDDVSETDVSLSRDGKVVAFASDSDHLVAGDSNTVEDIFVKNLVTGDLRCASVSAAGVLGNSASNWPSLNADGSVVAFGSESSNLVPGESNPKADIFVKNLATGEIRVASATASGGYATDLSYNPSLSADGRVVAFVSHANDLVPNDTNTYDDIYVKDMITGEIRAVSISAAGGMGDGNSDTTAVSEDGKKVAIVSDSTNLVPEDTNGEVDVFVADTGLGGTAPTLRLGDVTGDEKIDIQDAVLILQIVVGIKTPSEAQKGAGDVNKNSLISVEDAVLVLRYIVFDTPLE